MKGSPELISDTLADYEGNLWFYKQSRLHKLTVWEWKKRYTQNARLLGCVVSTLSMLVWVFMMDAYDFGPGSPSIIPILVIFAVALFVIPTAFGIIMTIPLMLDKRRYATTTKYAYYWRLNKDLRACVSRSLSPHEFSLLIETAQRADHKAYRLYCIDKITKSIRDWGEDGELPSIPEQAAYLEALRAATLA